MTYSSQILSQKLTWPPSWPLPHSWSLERSSLLLLETWGCAGGGGWLTRSLLLTRNTWLPLYTGHLLPWLWHTLKERQMKVLDRINNRQRIPSRLSRKLVYATNQFHFTPTPNNPRIKRNYCYNQISKMSNTNTNHSWQCWSSPPCHST